MTTKIEEAQAKVDAAEAELKDLQQKRMEVMRALAEAERDPTDPTAQSRLQSAVAAVYEIDQSLGRQRKEIRRAETELAETRESARRLAREVVQVEKTWTPRFDALADLERIAGELADLASFTRGLDWESLDETAKRLRSLVLSAKRQRQGLANGKRSLAALGDGGDGLTDEQRERWDGRGFEFGQARVYRTGVQLAQIEQSRQALEDLWPDIPGMDDREWTVEVSAAIGDGDG